MKSFLCITFALGLIVIASALTCNKCDFRAFSICFTRSTTCDGSGNCSNIKVSKGSFSLFSTQDCTDHCKEDKNITDNIFKFDYDTTCCSTDRCNSGNSVKISLSLGLGMALLWLLNAV